MIRLQNVATIFCLSILFNVIFPTGDVYSDIALMVNTITFKIANTLEMSGCRICHGKDETEVYKQLNGSCQQCLNSYACGSIPNVLNKKYDLQNKDTCQTDKWYVDLTSGSTDLKKGSCDRSKTCCIENKKELNSSIHMIEMNRKILITPDKFKRNCKKDFNVYLLAGNSSWLTCKHSFVLKSTQIELCTKSVANALDLKEKLFKIKKINDEHVKIIDGFTFEDGCGIYLRPMTMDPLTRQFCDDDACRVHLRYLQTYSSSIFDLSSWKSNIEYVSGYGKYGGKLCSLLMLYGYTMSVPILLNMAFSLKVFFDDYKKDKTTMIEIIFVIFLFYPQWKTLKFLAHYLIYHGDEKKLEKERDDFDRNVSTLEPFLESSIQVSFRILIILLLITHVMCNKHKLQYDIFTFILTGNDFPLHLVCNRRLLC